MGNVKSDQRSWECICCGNPRSQLSQRDSEGTLDYTQSTQFNPMTLQTLSLC